MLPLKLNVTIFQSLMMSCSTDMILFPLHSW